MDPLRGGRIRVGDDMAQRVRFECAKRACRPAWTPLPRPVCAVSYRYPATPRMPTRRATNIGVPAVRAPGTPDPAGRSARLGSRICKTTDGMTWP